MREIEPPNFAEAVAKRRTFVRHANSDPTSAIKVLEARAMTGHTPAVSALIPTGVADRGGHLKRLVAQLEEQTFQDFEVVIVQGDTRQGRALNTAAAAARGELLIIMDDDTSLGHPEVFENLVATMAEHSDIGMAGVANTVPDDASWLVRRVMTEIPRRHSEVVSEMVDSDMAEHPCCAIPKRVFTGIGGENEIIPRGLDPYLRHEIRTAGHRVVVIPNTYIHHLPPDRLFRLLRQFVRNGRQSALCTVRYPQWVIELTEQHGDEVPEKRSMLQRIGRATGRLAGALLSGRFIWFATTMAYQIGFTLEYARLSIGKKE
jgi:hypothetical protein